MPEKWYVNIERFMAKAARGSVSYPIQPRDIETVICGVLIAHCFFRFIESSVPTPKKEKPQPTTKEEAERAQFLKDLRRVTKIEMG